jgi:hypothetical protein
MPSPSADEIEEVDIDAEPYALHPLLAQPLEPCCIPAHTYIVAVVASSIAEHRRYTCS